MLAHCIVQLTYHSLPETVLEVIATHPRCYGHEQDVFNPLHYLTLLEQRPGAFEYARPLKQWRKGWPASYHRLLTILKDKWPEGRGVKEFVRILKLHQVHPAHLVEQAVEQALSFGCTHFDGVQHCLDHLHEPFTLAPLLDLSDKPHLATVGTQPLDLHCYDQLVERVAHS